MQQWSTRSTSSPPADHRREILESKAIQSLDTWSDGKPYRSWNQKLKNALDQARPGYRDLITLLESITEKEVQDEYNKAGTVGETKDYLRVVAAIKNERAARTTTACGMR